VWIRLVNPYHSISIFAFGVKATFGAVGAYRVGLVALYIRATQLISRDAVEVNNRG